MWPIEDCELSGYGLRSPYWSNQHCRNFEGLCGPSSLVGARGQASENPGPTTVDSHCVDYWAMVFTNRTLPFIYAVPEVRVHVLCVTLSPMKKGEGLVYNVWRDLCTSAMLCRIIVL